MAANALVAANKDFDFLLLPNRKHPTSLLDPYALRRLWNYFVRHLLGAEPRLAPASVAWARWANILETAPAEVETPRICPVGYAA
ncbi:MAG: hypothetical protein JRG95_04745 [Deltaproteobacteria bacterium]|nr:hypothetical protein [Deltaproteobacteria bacterium]